MKSAYLLACLFAPITWHAFAAEKELLHQSSQSWNGSEFNYPSGKAEITVVRLKLNPGDNVPFHCHPIPTFGYVVSGTIRVHLMNNAYKDFTAGDTVIEVMNTLHRGSAVDKPVEVLVFYAGAKDIPTTLNKDDPGCTQS